MTDTLVITNAGPMDEVFSNEVGSWNATRAMRDCRAGQYGEPFVMDIGPAVEANRLGETDEAKVLRYMGTPAVLAIPMVLVMENGKGWLIDGLHRLRALHRLGRPEITVYVIPEEHEPTYRVLFNGKRRLEDA